MLTSLGPFQILDEVGRGGMGTVYRGLDPIIGRPVAIKVIRLLGYRDSDEQHWMRDRLFREARAAGRLCHPGIVTIYQVGEDQDVAYIAMEFVDGPTLKKLFDSETLPDKEKLCRILVEAAAALDYAHDRGLVHRDIKPENIMVTEAGVTKVTDFGIAKTMLGQTATRTGAMAGTPLYMSPEQIRGKDLDGRSDQFALAVIAYYIFTGRAPFEAEQVTSLCYQIIHEEPPHPADLVPGIATELASVIMRGLSKERDRRFPTCTEFATGLLDAFAIRDRTDPKPPRFVLPVSVPPIARRTTTRVLTALGISAALLGSTAVLARRPQPTPPVVRHESPVQKQGLLVWTGKAHQGDRLTIEGEHASIGSLAGSLPGLPVRIKVYPAESAADGLTVFVSNTSDAAPAPVPTPRGPAAFLFDPRHATDVTVFDSPSPSNQWNNFSIQINADISALLVEWRSAPL